MGFRTYFKPESNDLPSTGVGGLPENWLELVLENETVHAADFALKFHKELNEGVAAVAEQIHCYQKARKKFPTLHQNGWIYRKKAIEQSSGEATALFKSRLYDGEMAVDLTGGLGIDTLCFSKQFHETIHVEPDMVTQLIARKNHAFSKASGIKYTNYTAEDFVADWPETEKADLAYADPSRRDDTRRYFLLGDCVPDIHAIWQKLAIRARVSMLKLSPMYDITALRDELPDLTQIYVVSVKGEVKEILAVRDSNTKYSGCRITAVGLHTDGEKLFEISGSTVLGFGENKVPQSGLYEKNIVFIPDAAISKAGLSAELANINKLTSVHQSHGLLCLPANGNVNASELPGNCYRIHQILPWNTSKVKKALHRQKLTRVHVHRSGFPLDTSTIYTRLNIKMGEDAHLLFTTNTDQSLLCLICSRLS
ncbi:MAG: class I SAM-dependent methyltransferase [Balneolales bacterium]|nr:class I SAM-dependent methyltransferase [Balneolales bacterium]